MSAVSDLNAVTIRTAVSEDADGIARAFLESAEYHAGLDTERYSAPAIESVSRRYRERRQHPRDVRARTIALVAELDGEIVGFVDARLERSPTRCIATFSTATSSKSRSADGTRIAAWAASCSRRQRSGDVSHSR